MNGGIEITFRFKDDRREHTRTFPTWEKFCEWRDEHVLGIVPINVEFLDERDDPINLFGGQNGG